MTENVFLISDNAAREMQKSAEAVGDKKLALRLTARKDPQGGIIYNMGFDSPKDDDISDSINGIAVLFDTETSENVKGMVVDFGPFEGHEQFVFVNPNDKSSSCSSKSDPSSCNPDGSEACSGCL